MKFTASFAIAAFAALAAAAPTPGSGPGVTTLEDRGEYDVSWCKRHPTENSNNCDFLNRMVRCHDGIEYVFSCQGGCKENWPDMSKPLVLPPTCYGAELVSTLYP